MFTLNSFSFFKVGSFFDTEGSAHNSADGIARILEKEHTDVCFSFKAGTFLDVEGLGEVN